MPDYINKLSIWFDQVNFFFNITRSPSNSVRAQDVGDIFLDALAQAGL